MTWTSPFALPGRWFKGNLHTHTTQSDGRFTPEQALAWYREHQYDFVALTDHWVYTAGQCLGPDFISVSGVELHGPGYHLLSLGGTGQPDEALADSVQDVVKAVRGLGGLPFMAHPYWTGQTSAEIAEIEGLAGIEVFNSVCEKMVGLGYARVHWDDLLGRGHRLWGLAVDDVHWKYGAQGQGFVMVRAEQLEEGAILAALQQGAFYASTGPRIIDLALTQSDEGKPALRVACSPCQTITFHALGSRGRRFEAAPGEALDGAVWPFPEEGVYLRVECRDAGGRIAWSNPVFVADL